MVLLGLPGNEFAPVDSCRIRLRPEAIERLTQLRPEDLRALCEEHMVRERIMEGITRQMVTGQLRDPGLAAMRR